MAAPLAHLRPEDAAEPDAYRQCIDDCRSGIITMLAKSVIDEAMVALFLSRAEVLCRDQHPGQSSPVRGKGRVGPVIGASASNCTTTRQSSHMRTRSSAASLPANIGSLASCLSTRSTVETTPKGLPQRMQANGSSSYRMTRSRAAAVNSRRGFSDTTSSGQVVRHSPH